MNDEQDVELPLRILHLEDSPRDAEIIRERIIDAGFSLQIGWAVNEREFATFLQRGGYDLIIADYLLPGFDAPAALKLAKSLCPELPFICVSGAIGEEKAVELLMQGATDYVLKASFDKLPLSIHRALAEVKEQNARRLAEEMLRKNEEKYRTVADFTYDWEYWIATNGQFIYCSASCERITGYKAEEFMNDPELFISIVYSDDRVLYQQHMDELCGQCSPPYEHDYRIISRSGETRWISHTCCPVYDRDKHYLGRRGCNRDISERKELEKRLIQSQKMEAIGTLAGGIAHDFNNILSAIFGYTELAIIEEDRDKCCQNLKQVIVASERAKELVKQILAVSRRADQEKQPLQVALLIKEALKMLRSSIPTTIEIRQNLTTNGIVLADPTQIHQVIMNLCTNAYHAMREHGGIMAVSLAEIEIQDEDKGYGELAPGKYMKLEVSDTGCGMSPQTQERIFEPYFTTKKIGEGTGLGLAVVHGVIKSHHGHITVYSELGKGTAFHVYLPLMEKNTDELPTQKAAEDLTGQGEHILFVDDEAQIRELANMVFTKNGYQVTVCTNGAQALEEFQSHDGKFDLVITDMTMPHMTGTELAQKIFDIRPDMPIILCTGLSELVNREKALAMGLCDYLNKPVLIHDYLFAVRKALGKGGQPRPD